MDDGNILILEVSIYYLYFSQVQAVLTGHSSMISPANSKERP